jgi:hypothetical protein
MDKKYGVYICEGCGIGESLDVKALCGVPEEEGVPVKTHPFLCGKDGVELLKKDIAGGTNTLVIAACSRRVNFDVFRFDGCIVDRVNLREGVVWSHPRSEFPALTEEEKEDEDNFDRVQMMAEDYIKMGMIRVEKIDAARALSAGEPVQKDSGSGRRHHRHVCGYRRGQGRFRCYDHRKDLCPGRLCGQGEKADSRLRNPTIR